MQTSKKENPQTTESFEPQSIGYGFGVTPLKEKTEEGFLQAMVVYPSHQPEIAEQLKHMLHFFCCADPQDVFNVYVRVFAADLQTSELDGMFFNSADKTAYLSLMHVLARMARTQHHFNQKNRFEYKEQYLEYKKKYEELLADTYD